MNEATKWQLTTSGAIYVRITKPGLAQETLGALVISYVPYMGA